MNVQKLPLAAAKWAKVPMTMGDLGLLPAEHKGAARILEAGSCRLTAAEGATVPNPHYVWRLTMLRAMVGFWERGTRALMLHGPTGSGKTSLVEQWHSALNWPLYSVTGHSKFMIDDLFVVPGYNKDGVLVMHDGPLLKAARSGTSLLFNEINACRSDVLVALNEWAQAGSVITIPLTGEVIAPAEGFRIFATKNPEGTVYTGRQTMDTSTRHRFRNLTVPFPDRDDELQILLRNFVANGYTEDSAIPTATAMVDMANELRAICTEVSDKPDAIDEVVSTRILVAWIEELATYQRLPAALHIAMASALTDSSDPKSRKVIHDKIESKFGIDRNGKETKKAELKNLP